MRAETQCEATEPAYAVWKTWPAVLVALHGGGRAKAGAEGINRRQFFAPAGDLDVLSGFEKNGDAHGMPSNEGTKSSVFFPMHRSMPLRCD